MKIEFCLVWKSRNGGQKNFKSRAAEALFREYAARIAKFSLCETKILDGIGLREKSGTAVWVCDRGAGSRMLSSEELARVLSRARDGGIRDLKIFIGGPDGFSENELSAAGADLRWSFGPLTLPHELAAAVAAEQVYRAWTILAGMPYHGGH